MSTCIGDTQDLEQWIISGGPSAQLCSELQVGDLLITSDFLTIQCGDESCELIRGVVQRQQSAIIAMVSIISLLIGVILGVLVMHFLGRQRCHQSRRRVSSAPKETGKVEEPASVSRIHLSDDSFLPVDEESFRPPIPSNWDDGETMEGFSISGIDLPQPSLRSVYVNRGDDETYAKSLPLVVERSVKAPPGKLGVALNVMSEGPKVRYIKEGSPMEGLLFVGDVIIQLNEHDTRKMTTSAIYRLLEETNALQRTMKVQTIDDVNRK